MTTLKRFLLAAWASVACFAIEFWLRAKNPGESVLVYTFHGKTYYRYPDGTRILAISGATALAADKQYTRRGDGDLRNYKVADNIKIYKGAICVLDTSGYVRPARNNATDLVVVGLAEEQVDNTLTGHTAGGKSVRIRSGCHFDLLAAGTATQASVGQVFYALDDQTVQAAATAQPVGFVTEFVSATEVWVYIATPSVAGNSVAAVGSGYKIARGQATTATASDTVVTGLATVVAAIASLESDPVDDPFMCTAAIGDQAGTPAAGSILIKTWKNTGGTDPTPAAATTFTKKVNWVAIGT